MVGWCKLTKRHRIAAALLGALAVVVGGVGVIVYYFYEPVRDAIVLQAAASGTTPPQSMSPIRRVRLGHRAVLEIDEEASAHVYIDSQLALPSPSRTAAYGHHIRGTFAILRCYESSVRVPGVKAKRPAAFLVILDGDGGTLKEYAERDATQCYDDWRRLTGTEVPGWMSFK